MDKQALIEQLKIILGSAFSFYLKAQNYHWNVTGPNFAQYHDFFGELYEEVYESVDDIAEEIRKHNEFAPGSLARFSELSVIDDEVNIPETTQMFKRLANDNLLILREYYKAREAADEIGAFGTVNFIEDRISVHEKHQWMLNSF